MNSGLIAALSMYDRPETAAATDRFWSTIRNVLGQGPTRLTRNMDLWEIWLSPRLLFAQTCGLPYRSRLHDHVQLVGTPDYGLPDCPAGYYQSVFITRKGEASNLDSYDNTRFAYNESLSQSGWAAPMAHLAGSEIRFAKHIQSGAHAKSAWMIANGEADIAALDALTWTLMVEHDPQAQHLQVIAKTSPTPGLPYVTSPLRDKNALGHAVRQAIEELSHQDRAVLHLRSLVDIPARDYLAIPAPPPPT